MFELVDGVASIVVLRIVAVSAVAEVDASGDGVGLDGVRLRERRLDAVAVDGAVLDRQRRAEPRPDPAGVGEAAVRRRHAARLPVIVLFLIVSVAKNRFETPPCVGVAREVRAGDVVRHGDALERERTAVGDPAAFALRERAGAAGARRPIGAVSVGAARLPVTTLSRSVTTAPPESLPET